MTEYTEKSIITQVVPVDYEITDSTGGEVIWVSQPDCTEYYFTLPTTESGMP